MKEQTRSQSVELNNFIIFENRTQVNHNYKPLNIIIDYKIYLKYFSIYISAFTESVKGKGKVSFTTMKFFLQALKHNKIV